MDNQLCEDIESIVRNVVRNNVFAQNAQEVYYSKDDIADQVQQMLVPFIQRWGIEIIDLIFESVKVDRELLRGINKRTAQAVETEDKRIEAEREATHYRIIAEAHADAEAHRIDTFIRILQERGLDLSKDDLVKIVRSPMEELADFEKRLVIHRQNLANHLEQLARTGTANARTDLLNSIDEERHEIRNIKRILRALGVQVDDHPDDEPIARGAI